MEPISVFKDATIQEQDAGNVLTGFQSVGFSFVLHMTCMGSNSGPHMLGK